MHYANLFDKNSKYSVLPESCQRAIRSAAGLPAQGVWRRKSPQNLQNALFRFREEISRLPPDLIVRAATEIRNIARLWPIYYGYNARTAKTALTLHDSEVMKMDENPELAVLYLFHGEGRLREAALCRIDPTNISPFLFTAIVFRLNDWAEPVRKAAAELLGRVQSAGRPEKYASAIPFLAVQTTKWMRWQTERSAYLTFQNSPEIVEFVAHMLVSARTGPLAKQLRALMRNPAIDKHLPLLAQAAHASVIRALALEALLAGQARWVVGRQKRWIDKLYGVYRMEHVWETRQITQPVNTKEFLRLGAMDKSVVVRRVVAYRILQLAEDLPDIAALLAQDKSPSIRNVISYYQRKRAEQ